MLMMKNEARIVERCLGRALPFVDGVAILDTGSTDDSVALCTRYLEACGKPFRIETEPFVNFGVSRTASFHVARRLCDAAGWDAVHTYALALDADMLMVASPEFTELRLHDNAYKAIQLNGSLQYFNLRLLKLSYPWKCVGSTHEYWDGDSSGVLDKSVFHIEDKNDGGCKADKFERDIRLLTADIDADPRNVRAHYYLGQSLKDVGRFDDAIAMFEKRIALGGWAEECWYAHLQIGRCYDSKGDEAAMEFWMNKAFAFRPKRAEPLYHLARVFRERSQHYKAYHYYLKGRHIAFPSDDILFIEKAVYEGLFEYENTILACYIRPTEAGKLESQLEVIQYLNTWPHHHANVFSNLVFYASALLGSVYGGEYAPLVLAHYTPATLLAEHRVEDEYRASSCSVVPAGSGEPGGSILMNVRYVNYRIDEHGAYHMRSRDGVVRTKNALVRLSATGVPVARPRFVHETYAALPGPARIEGLEDVRLFYSAHAGKLQFTASCADIVSAEPASGAAHKIVIVHGDYEVGTPADTSVPRICNVKPLASPIATSVCEKNWLHVPSAFLSGEHASASLHHFIYSWHPFQIGAVDTHAEHRQLRIHTTQQTPAFFEHFRGSCAPVEYNGKVYVLVHHVKYCSPRIYLHGLVQCSRTTMHVEQYTPLFYFRQRGIEYCTGMHFNTKTDQCMFFISENDSNPGCVSVAFKKFKWIPV